MRRILKEDGLIKALTILKEKFGDNEDAAAQVFGNVRALRGLFGLVGKSAEQNIGIFARLAAETEDGIGKAFAITAERDGFAFQQVLAQIAATAIAVGNAITPVVLPAIKKFGAVVADLTAKFEALDPRFQKFAIYAVLIAAALGPVLITIGLMASGIAALSVSMLAWTAGVGAGIALVAKNWDAAKQALATFVEFATPALDSLKDLALEVFGRIKEFALSVLPAIQDLQ